MAAKGKIGFIGAGKMGGTLLEGVLRAGVAGPEEILVCEPERARRDALQEKFGVRAVALPELAKKCGTLLLCVKPNLAPGVLKELEGTLGKDQLLISIAAGVTTASLETGLGKAVPVVRAMPNIAATVGLSATAIAAGRFALERHLESARRILGAAGIVVELPEGLLDAVTGLSGSGPAYVFLFAEALLSGALKVGLPAAEARALAVQTIKGAAAMLEADPSVHPAVLRDAVTTPGGTTIAGLHELESRGFRDGVIRAIEAATEKSRLLGKSLAGKN